MNKATPVARKPTLYVMIGPAGSGKSTVAMSIPDTVICSTDAIRSLMFKDAACQGNPKEVFREAYSLMLDALCNGENVVFDATNTTEKGRKELLEQADAIQCRKVAIYMNTPLAECQRRNKLRQRQVPDEVIDRQYMQMIRDAASIPVQFDEIVIVEGWNKK